MSIYKNNKKARRVYKGTTPFVSVYLGEKNIFHAVWALSATLINATMSEVGEIYYGKPLTCTITPNSGCQMLPWNTVVTMGGTDITATAYNPSTNAISIAKVTGDIVISAEAVQMSSDYVPVEYIASPNPGTASSVLNTGYAANNKTKIMLDVNLVERYPTLLYGSSSVNSAAPAIRFAAWIKITDTLGAFAWGPNRYGSTAGARLQCGVRQKFTCDRGVYTFKKYGNIAATTNIRSDDVWTETSNIRIFDNNSSTHYYGSGKIYKIEISEIDIVDSVEVETMKRNYVPAKRVSDNVGVLYDVVNQSAMYGTGAYITPYILPTCTYTNCTATLLSNAVTGTATRAVIGSTWSVKISPSSGYTFIGNNPPTVSIDNIDVSSDVVTDNGDGTYTITIQNVPDKPITINAAAIEIPYDAEVEYLQGDGSAYIDTNLYGNINLDYEVQAQYTGSKTSYNILGDRAAASLRRFTIQINTTGTYFAYVNAGDSNNQVNVSSSYRTTSFFIFKKQGLDVYIGNTKIGSFTSQTFTTPRTILLFAARNNGSLLYPFEGKIKYCKFISNDILVRDYISVRKDGVGYLYDKMSGQLYGNANSSGAFTYGSDVTANALSSSPTVEPLTPMNFNEPDVPMDEPNNEEDM